MSNDTKQPSLSLNFGNATPIMPVADLSTSLAYYTEKLGFKIDWRAHDSFASVSRDKCTIFLAAGDQGNTPTWAWIGISDTAALFEEYVKTGARIRHAPANFEWALEMQIVDPAGNVLRFGSDPDEGGPSAEWRDMHGDYWTAIPEGGWTKIEEADAARYFLDQADRARQNEHQLSVRWNLFNAVELLRIHGTEAELEAALAQFNATVVEP